MNDLDSNQENKKETAQERQATDTESLRMEYEQTVQTMRNWDTIFGNATASLIITGGIGSMVAMASAKDKPPDYRLFASVFFIGLFLLAAAYFTYNVGIVTNKVVKLQKIEEKLNMIGMYRGKVRTEASKVLKVGFLVMFILLLVIQYIIWNAGR